MVITYYFSMNFIIDVRNKSLINDPTIQLPRMDLPRGQWSLLNRFRTACMSGVKLPRHSATAVNPKTMRHIVNECPLTCFDGGISELDIA